MRFRVTLAFLLVMACGDSTAPTPTVNGSWTGSSGNSTITMTLVENGGVISGSGTMSTPSAGATAISVSGSSVDGDVSMTLSSQFNPVSLAGSVSAEAIVGKLNGSGFANETIVLKHP